jgi:curved DNA-binding protein CbpA
MFEKKMHPDLGGDHAAAAAINEGYAVLSEKAKQAEFHRTFALKHLQETRPSGTSRPSRSAMSERFSANPAPLKKPSFEFCPLCRAKLPQSIAPESRCDRCHSPLDEPPASGKPGSEVFGRRSSLRTAKNNFGTVFTAEYPEGLNVRMRDLSLNGISFVSEAPLLLNQTFRFHDSTLEAVASVVSCNRQGKSYSIHSRLLTVGFHHKAGVFLSAIG